MNEWQIILAIAAALISVAVENPSPLSLQDVRALMLGQGSHDFASDVVFAALSNEIEPIGITPTLSGDVPIATPWGYRRADTLLRGDTVYTHGGEVVPVLHTVTRTVPARGSFAPIRLRAPYYGLKQDIVVAPDQRVVIDGPEVEYMFNQESVLTPARHLVNGFAALDAHCGPTIAYTQVILPGHETMMVANAPLESLFVGRIRRNMPQLEASVLNGIDRNTLPEHGRESHKVLKWYEAISLAKRRAA